jgi:rhodanese-related sulfurtransferase
MQTRNLKVVLKQDLVRLMVLLLSSLVLAIIMNMMHPMGLPLLLTEVDRPGIPRWIWKQFRYADVRSGFDKVSTGPGTLVDVRDRDDYRKSHAAGAINLPYHGFEEHFSAFAKKVSNKEPLFIYCYGTQCGLSARVAKRLLVLGFENLTIIKQGFKGWEKSNLPIEKTQSGDKHGVDE